MDAATYLAAIDRDGRSMIAIAASTPENTAVPSCPDWTLRDLMVHTGVVHRHKTVTVREGWVDGSPPRPAEPEGDVVAWFADGLDDMLSLFAEADLDSPTWTWCDHEHTADWWVRRMAHETMIHAADATLASGGVPDLDPELALDGVDEILDEMMVGGPSWGTVSPGERVIVLEAGGRWWALRTARFTGTSPSSGTAYDMATLVHEDDADQPDAVVRTDPSTLDLWLWGRAALPDGAVEGDVGLVDEVRALAAEATG